jgi:hypothetical protein
MSADVLSVWPVLEFRPVPGFFVGNVRRYADGNWLADDGEYDLAFIGFAVGGYPCSLYVSLPYQRNILAKWYSRHWAVDEPRHEDGNAWHYHLRRGKRSWGGDWGRSNHPNTRAGDAGMNKICSEAGCANGRHVEPHDIFDKHTAAGLVRERQSGLILGPPEKLRCMYCKDDAATAIARVGATP